MIAARLKKSTAREACLVSWYRFRPGMPDRFRPGVADRFVAPVLFQIIYFFGASLQLNPCIELIIDPMYGFFFMKDVNIKMYC